MDQGALIGLRAGGVSQRPSRYDGMTALARLSLGKANRRAAAIMPAASRAKAPA